MTQSVLPYIQNTTPPNLNTIPSDPLVILPEVRNDLIHAILQAAERGDTNYFIYLCSINPKLLGSQTSDGMSIMHVAAKNKRIPFILYLCKQLGLRDCLLFPYYPPSSKEKKTPLYYLLDAMTKGNNVLEEEQNEMDLFFTVYDEDLRSILIPFWMNQCVPWLPDSYFKTLLPVLVLQADIFMEFDKEARFSPYFNLLKEKVDFLKFFLSNEIFQQQWNIQLDAEEFYATQFAHNREAIWEIRERLFSMLYMKNVDLLYRYMMRDINYDPDRNPYDKILKRVLALLARI